jgi:hypothetical protein
VLWNETGKSEFQSLRGNNIMSSPVNSILVSENHTFLPLATTEEETDKEAHKGKRHTKEGSVLFT